jgi:hypothetical protein
VAYCSLFAPIKIGLPLIEVGVQICYLFIETEHLIYLIYILTPTQPFDAALPAYEADDAAVADETTSPE